MKQHTIQAHDIIYSQLDAGFGNETKNSRDVDRRVFVDDHLEIFRRQTCSPVIQRRYLIPL
jgi:hypothetical protein